MRRAGERVDRRHRGRGGGNAAPARPWCACGGTPWGGAGAEARTARHRVRGRPGAGPHRDRRAVLLGLPVAIGRSRTMRRRRVGRARARTFGAGTPDRSPGRARGAGGAERGGSDRGSGRGSMCRHARRRRARYRRALSLRRGRRGRRSGDGRRGRGGRGARSGGRLRGRRGGRSGSRRRRRGCRTGREQSGGIHVCVAVAAPYAEVHVRRVVLRVARYPGCGEHRPLEHDVAAAHQQRAEMRQRGLVPVARRNGHGEPMRGHRPGEGDLARRGGARSRRVPERDVDASMLPARVRVVAERERAKDRAARRPAPGSGVGRSRERPYERERREEHPRCR